MSRFQHQRAFSLVELLVVVGIIAILAGLLIPVVGRMRDVRERTECSNNQRQIGMGIMAYANDHDGFLPGPLYAGQMTDFQKLSAWTYYQGRLTDYLYPYMGIPEPSQAGVFYSFPAFRCPAWARIMAPASKTTGSRLICYVTTGTYFGYFWNSTKPTSVAAITDAVNTEALTEADSAMGYSSSTALPAKAVHGTVRNHLYFDGHVETK